MSSGVPDDRIADHEVRLIDTNRGKVVGAGYFDNPDAIMTALEKAGRDRARPPAGFPAAKGPYFFAPSFRAYQAIPAAI